MAVEDWQGTGKELAELVMSRRERHLVIISRVAGNEAHQFDVETVAAEVEGWADVVPVVSGYVTYQLKSALPSGWDVYGTAARVYPRGMERGLEPGRYYLAENPGQVSGLTQELLDDVLGRPGPEASAKAGGTAGSGPHTTTFASTSRLPAAGMVSGIVGTGERAIVELDTGDRVIVRREDLGVDARLDWILAAGQRVIGSLEPQGKVLDIRNSVTIPRLAVAFSWRQVVLCLVLSADPDHAVLAPLPGVKITVRRADVSSNPLDDVDTLLAPGQVVSARLVQHKGVPGLLLTDVDDDEPVVPAPVLVAGGGPWLRPGRDLLPDTGTHINPVEGMDGSPSGAGAPGAADSSVIEDPGSQRGKALQGALMTIERLKAELRTSSAGSASQQKAAAEVLQLAKQVEEMTSELEEVVQELSALKTKHRRQTELLNASQKKARKVLKSVREHEIDWQEHFADDDAAVRHELYLAWVERTPASDKKNQPWTEDYIVGRKFQASYFDLPVPLRRKTAKAIVHLLTGRAADLPARELHPLRSGIGANDSQVAREDGALCWRMAVEKDVAAARRVHYWKLHDGGIELHEVVAHEVVVP